jgi:class 3 adenylate cyclase
MILFGAPTSHGDDAQNAVSCALEMISERDRLNADSQEPLGIGIGIATGTAVAGCIGAENRADYTVVGEHVNLAARLCSSAAAGEIIADAATLALLPTTFQTQPLHPLKLKGFAEPVAAFRVISTTAV